MAGAPIPGGFGAAPGAAASGLGAAGTAAETGGLGTAGAAGAAMAGLGARAGAGGMPGGLGGAGILGGEPTAVGSGFGGRLTMAASRGLAALGFPSWRGGRTMRTVSFLGSFMAGFYLRLAVRRGGFFARQAKEN